MPEEVASNPTDMTDVVLVEEEKEETKDNDATPDSVTMYGIQDYHVYCIYGWHDKGYLSNDTASCWIHQNKPEPDKDASLFEFIPCTGKYRGCWYIRNTALNKWLSYGSCQERGEHMIGLWSDKINSSNWKLIPSPQKGTQMCWVFECFYNGVSKGYLGYQSDGKWNKLYDDEGDAASYTLELMQ
eukprot:325217_1